MTNKLMNDQSAVSPVIGVILMVAITVVLAAVVVILVMNLADTQSQVAPQISMLDNGDSSYTVSHATPKLVYEDLTISGCDTVPTGDVLAGDTWLDCDTGHVTVTYVPMNQLIYQG